MKKMRQDGKTQKTLFWLCIFSGIIGGHFFYLGQKKLGKITALISWVSSSLATLLWIVYASVEVGSDFNYNLYIVLPTVLLLVPLMLVFIWTIYLSITIVTGSYLDENKIPVSKWNATQQDVINYYLNL